MYRPPVHIDFETRSTVDLKRTGVYPYAQHPTTDIWLAAYAFGDEEPLLWHLGEHMPERLADHVAEKGELHAWNAQFERTLWRCVLSGKHGWPEPNFEQWVCTMAAAAASGLPQGLGQCAKLLKVNEQKSDAGHRAMLQMCRPRRTTSDGTPEWWDTADRLNILGDYCEQDVRTERSLKQMLSPLSTFERKVWLLDQTINNRGLLLDRPFCEAARDCAEVATQKANDRLAEITCGEVLSVTAVADLAAWVTSRGTECGSVAKPAVAEMLADPTLPPDVVEALAIRTEAGKASVAKLTSMLEYADGTPDDRMRGMLAYHAASTGRWAGRGPQPHNFPRGTVKDALLQRGLVLARNVEGMDLIAPPMETISTMLRNMFIAAKGHKLMVGDFASIEARVVAWLAGQDDLLDIFRTGGDPYRSMAASIFGKPVSEISKTSTARQIGKVAVLGLGFQMGAARFVEQVKLQTGIAITEAFGQEVVNTYRAENAKIKAMWWDINCMAIAAVKQPGTKHGCNKVAFARTGDWLHMVLPSGRKLRYPECRIVPQLTPWGEVRDTVQFTGMHSITKQWCRQTLYGGLLVENAVQAVARDILAEAMLRVEEAGYPMVLTVHDELVAEPLEDFGSEGEFEKLMCTLPAWAEGLPVAAEIWSGPRYRK